MALKLIRSKSRWIPNQRALATNFVLLDNYYCNGVATDDGHMWCTQGNAGDPLQRAVGGFNGPSANDEPHIGDSHNPDPNNGYPVHALQYSFTGFIWDNVSSHGHTYTNFGELVTSSVPAGSTWLGIYNHYTNGDYASGLSGGIPPFPNNFIFGLTNLNAHTSTNFPGWYKGTLLIPDILRAEAFSNELHNADITNHSWPKLTIMHLPNDHTSDGGSGKVAPCSAIADNDLAVGRIVEAISHSSFWSTSVIFIIEDDPQGSGDHVDFHRSICLVVSPYTKRHQTISTFYNQPGLLHTMEQILRLPPMGQMDAIGPLMGDCFTPIPDFTPFVHLTNQVPLDTVYDSLGMDPCMLSPKAQYWVRKSLKLDMNRPDSADPDVLNHLIWYWAKGDKPYPTKYTRPNPKALRARGLILIGSQNRDDD